MTPFRSFSMWGGQFMILGGNGFALTDPALAGPFKGDMAAYNYIPSYASILGPFTR